MDDVPSDALVWQRWRRALLFLPPHSHSPLNSTYCNSREKSLYKELYSVLLFLFGCIHMTMAPRRVCLETNGRDPGRPRKEGGAGPKSPIERHQK